MPEEARGREGRCVVIACRVMEPELTHVFSGERKDDEEVDIRYLDQTLHQTPGKILRLVQEEIDRVAQTAARIVLGYGLCSNGVVGVTARRQGLIIPRCHDCIALFLGSPERYQELFRSNAGTYYLTSGWIAKNYDPLGLIEEQIPRYGLETAWWVIEEELKNYSKIALIDTKAQAMAPLRARAMENATALHKQYVEIPGSLDYFRELINGPYTLERFLRLAPGATLTQEMFF